MRMSPDAETINLALMDPVFEAYRGQPGALIPVLQKAQSFYGYLPKEVLELIARKLGIALSKIYGVATFYAQFYLERKGRHMLKLCDGTACHVKGAPALLNAAEESLGAAAGQTTKDGELTVEIVYCMGSCALAPVAVIDGQVAGRLQPDTFLRRVKKQIGTAETQAEEEVAHGGDRD
jgi:NADH:ubiquinone oxidoreductase subunit E